MSSASKDSEVKPEDKKRRAVEQCMRDKTLSPKLRQAKIQQILAGGDADDVQEENMTEKEKPIEDTYKTRTGRDLPNMPELLSILSNDEKAQDILLKLDIEIDQENTWSNAYDCDDHFNFDLRYDNEVIRFAVQGTGSIFGILVGKEEVSNDNIIHHFPVVHIDSEGSASRISSNLSNFWKLALSLNSHLIDVVSYVGSSALGEDEPNDEIIDNTKQKILGYLRKWRSVETSNNTTANADEEEEINEDVITLEEKQYMARLCGNSLGDEDIVLISDECAVDEIFLCDFSEPRWRPTSLD